MGDNITEKQKELVTNNHNLIYSFLQKHHLSIEEWYGLAAIGLCNAAMTFDETLSSFSSYAYKCMFTTVYTEKRKEKREKVIPQSQIVYYQAELDNSNGGDTGCFLNKLASKENVENDVLAKVLLDEYIKSLFNDRDKKIIQMFKEGYTQKEIAEKLDCTRAKVGEVKKKLIEYLKK